MSPARGLGAVRRRGLLMLCCALVCGGLAASQVRERERRAEAVVGPIVPVVVAARDLPAERRLRSDDAAIARRPARFVPPDALRSSAGLSGARIAASVAAGSYLTAGLLEGTAAERGGGLRAGERAVELAVAGGGLAGASPGSRMDVVVSTQPGDAAARTFVALEDVELLALQAAGASEGGTPTALATLRVTARQAVYLAAAANVAREVRLLVRPPGDHKRIGPAAVGEAGL